jgi:amidohydrolase
MASADEIYVTVRGKGGHGANPQDAIDPVLITAHLITALQQIVSRNATPAMPSVLTFGKVIANGATNIIPDEVYLEGTFRTFDEEWRDKAHQRMQSIAKGIVEGMGGTVDFNIKKGYPVLKNDEDLAARTREYAVDFLGEEKVVDLSIRTTAEDFAYYTQAVPSVFYRIGTGKDADTQHALHTSKFNIDETALETGMGFMAWVAVSELAKQ